MGTYYDKWEKIYVDGCMICAIRKNGKFYRIVGMCQCICGGKFPESIVQSEFDGYDYMRVESAVHSIQHLAESSPSCGEHHGS